MFDLRLTLPGNPLSKPLSLTTQIRNIHHEIISLSKLRNNLLTQIMCIDCTTAELQKKSKSLQIQVFEESNNIIPLTNTGTVRKIRERKTPPVTLHTTPADLSVDQMEAFISSLPEIERDLFITSLLK